MARMPDVLASAQFIASKSRHVTISGEGVDRAVKFLAQEGSFKQPKPRNEEIDFEPPGLSDTEVLEWLFLIDTLNFCFWADQDTDPFTVSYRDVLWTGSRSLTASLARAVEGGTPVFKPSFYGSVTIKQMKSIFCSENTSEMPLLQQRMEALHEAAEVLNKEFGGEVSQLVARADRSAQKLVSLLGQHFSSYHDRAQLLVGDIWTRFGGCGFGEFYDIHMLTMFADYRVPQVLQCLGVLKYSEELLGVLEQGQHIPMGDDREVEIRGCSIWAVELVRQKLSRTMFEDGEGGGDCVKTVLIDHFLWTYASTHRSEMAPFPIHRTRTVFY